MGGAGVEQRRRTGQVVEVAQALVQRQRFRHVLAQRAGDAQEELLRRLDHLARVRVAQQVTVVQRAQAEIIEVAVERSEERRVGKEGVREGMSRWSAVHKNKKTKQRTIMK